MAVLVFDIDGTLLTTGGAGARAWGEAFAELYGVPANIEDYTEAGMPDQEVGRITFAEVIGREPTVGELAKVMGRYLDHLPRAVAESSGYRVLPGVTEVLPRLAQDGYLLGLTTGNVEAAAHIKLARGDLNRFFSFGGYGSDSADRGVLTRVAIERAEIVAEATIDPHEVLVIGDTPRDIAAARAVGAVAVAVASGHYSVDELRESGADYVLKSLEEELPL